MPSEYEALVAALKLTSIPFAEYGWKARPEGTYGVVQLDFEAGNMEGDGAKIDRSWEGSVDLFYQKINNRSDLMAEVEEILTEILGDSWHVNSMQYEHETGLFHVEWVFECQDVSEPEEEPEPETEPGAQDAGGE